MHEAYVLPGPLALSRSTVDRAADRRADAAWLDSLWADGGTRVLLVGDGTVPVDGAALRFVAPADAPDGDRFLLGLDDGVAYVAVHVGEKPDGAATLREVGAVLGDRDAGLAVHAIALANWHASHPFCPRCGGRTRSEQGGHVRVCEVEGSQHFPRTDPAIIVLVVDQDERCLLGRSAAWPGRRFSTLAGFVEPGETPEHAVVRELFEEVGVLVTSCAYAGAQPWPFPSSLMLGYYATAGGEEPTPDGEEIAEARWFSRDELTAAMESGDVLPPSGISIARKLVEGWYGRPLPVDVSW
ncbi:NAD(+) diphosphatase [Jiangella alkaliphila]|uniref:NAD(+) diphosphatase n=1 Tax=Jiangella alkaliphila TaxID=419479 RepID=A0A1H2JGH8_9ACTN|nr:NAD(+) diphosphatase [Jiangella alkaliphila]SDU55256.1 NAD+ diphosphatase [Jiangella alkaliphila]